MAGPFESLLSALCNPTFYPHRPAEVRVLETHISWVFVAGELVYKCKKPVRFDFLDFSTLARRKQACEDEVRLNQRLAPETYRAVVPVTRMGEDWTFNGDGPVVEWLVEMRRLPVEQSLDRKLWRNEVSQADIAKLAGVLIPFYRNQQPVNLAPADYHRQLIAHVQQNRQELLASVHHLPVDAIKRIHAAQLSLLQLHPAVFDRRVIAGQIVEGHGDLRPEHICFADRPLIFDCIEFSPEFRKLDVADDLAFLAMECDQMGFPWIGKQIFEQFQQLTVDQIPDSLINFYKSYRACVRAKVAALRAEQLSRVEREASICQARNYIMLADHYLKDAEQPLLLAIGGLSGTGKSSLARSLGDALGAEVLRTDILRRELFPNANAAAINDGAYQPNSRERVYLALLQAAEQRLRCKCPVILDATFAERDQIAAAFALARSASAPFLAVECECPAELALERIRARIASAADASQANDAVYHNQRKHWQTWAAEIPQKRINTIRPLSESTQLVLTSLAHRMLRPH